MSIFLRLFFVLSLLFPGVQLAFGSVVSPGDVIKGHAKEDENCDKCHKKFDKGAQSSLCKECHKDVGRDISEKRGYHGRLQDDKPCKECHTDHKGRDAKIVILDTGKFDHSQTDFQLKGGHLNEKVKCKSCHIEGKKYTEAPSTCNACHKKDDKHKGGLGTDCAKCHVEKDWKTTNFDHSKTNFKLLGKHFDVKCDKCHINGKYKDTPKTCVACHKKDDEKAHKGKLGTDCAKCHSEKDWKTTKFDHDKTNFKLLGKHDEVKCDKCHIDKKYKDTPKLCNSCHKKDDEKAHKGKFGPKCETCHTERDWKEILFDHEKKTKFPLLGKHRAPLKCVSCHKGDLYKDKLLMTCVSCHKKDDDKAHKGNFGPKCESCHVERDWKEILFDHTKQTKYPLLGKHKPAKCVSCHKGDLYKDKLQTTCVSCHKKDDDKAHKGNFGPKCESCHVERDWKEVLFDHDKKTKFPLLGKHRAPLKCVSCHKGDLYKDKLQTTCLSCHEKDDKHKGQEGKKCETCHNEQNWKKTTFNHNNSSMSKFPLLGSHATVECKKCHAAVTFKDAKPECWSCHEKDDEKIHKRRFGTECQECHNARSWKSWDFDHDKTRFKLVGPHKNIPNCYKCHQRPMDKKVNAPQTCGGCHDRDDVHNGDFGPQCDRCHAGDKWREVRVGAGK
ncbi:MAG: cytochrome C [Gallionellaceae bacterium]|jgi:hypothetical protein